MKILVLERVHVLHRPVYINVDLDGHGSWCILFAFAELVKVSESCKREQARGRIYIVVRGL